MHYKFIALSLLQRVKSIKKYSVYPILLSVARQDFEQDFEQEFELPTKFFTEELHTRPTDSGLQDVTSKYYYYYEEDQGKPDVHYDVYCQWKPTKALCRRAALPYIGAGG